VFQKLHRFEFLCVDANFMIISFILGHITASRKHIRTWFTHETTRCVV
jgi:hypothetical protein